MIQSKEEEEQDRYLCPVHTCLIQNMTDRFEELLRQTTQTPKGKHVLLAGDVSCPDIDWKKLTVKKGAADRQGTPAGTNWFFLHTG